MTCEEVIRSRVAEIEAQLQKVEKKLVPGPNALKYAVEAEKMRYAIQELYLCLGRIGK